MSRRRKWLIVILVLVASIAAGAVFLYARPWNAYSLAEFRVARLTCNACVQKLAAVMEPLPGVGKMEVSVQTARALVEFDPGKIDPGKIRDAIMAAGYPAFLVRTVSAEERTKGGDIGAAAAATQGGCACCEKK